MDCRLYIAKTVFQGSAFEERPWKNIRRAVGAINFALHAKPLCLASALQFKRGNKMSEHAAPAQLASARIPGKDEKNGPVEKCEAV